MQRLYDPTPTHISHYFYFNDPASPAIYTLSLHDALPISGKKRKTRWIKGIFSRKKHPGKRFLSRSALSPESFCRLRRAGFSSARHGKALRRGFIASDSYRNGQRNAKVYNRKRERFFYKLICKKTPSNVQRSNL